MLHTFNTEGTPIDLATWPRRALFELFSTYAEPFHGVCVRVDCTASFRYAKQQRQSVFLTLLHRALLAAHQVSNFKLRIVDGQVVSFNTIHGGSAVGRADETIAFGHYPFHPQLHAFVTEATEEIARVRQRTDLERFPLQNLIRFSVLPWLDFTSIDHARDFTRPDSAPKISFGKITHADGRCTMPVSIHAHHALADGLHVGRFVEHFERYLADPTLE